MPRWSRASGARSRPRGFERLESRAVLSAADPFAALLSHNGLCGCPICTGQVLAAAEPAQGLLARPAPAVTTTSLSPAPGVPRLASRPGAAATLYLDFDGHVESRWGEFTNVVSPAYDLDGNPTRFSAAEIDAIEEIWARVAEDYAPLNVNVTTIAPPQIADRMAVRMVIGGNYSDWFGSAAGGVAYVGGFTSGAPNVGYVFEDALAGGNPRYVAEAASHEAGHLFGLSHQAQWNGGQLVTEYHAGNADWAPIMGVSYYAGRTTWTRGPTSAGAASVQDDLAVLGGPTNGFGFAADDFGNTMAAAGNLTASGTSVHVAGLIGTHDDQDVLRFSTSGGTLRLALDVAPVGANLDGVLELKSASGQRIAIASPSNRLGAELTATLQRGTYFLVIRSSGGYGNLGRYTVKGQIAGFVATGSATPPATPTPPPPTSPPAPPPPTTPTPPPTDLRARIADNRGSGFTLTGTWLTASGAGYASEAKVALAGQNATATWTLSGLAPGQYRLAATWPSSRLNATSVPITILAGNQVLGAVRINQQRAASTFAAGGVSWQSLGVFTVRDGTLTVRMQNAAAGRTVADAIRLERVSATSGGTALNGAVLATELLAVEGLSTGQLEAMPLPALEQPDVPLTAGAEQPTRGTLTNFAPQSRFRRTSIAADETKQTPQPPLDPAAIDVLCAILDDSRPARGKR